MPARIICVPSGYNTPGCTLMCSEVWDSKDQSGSSATGLGRVPKVQGMGDEARAIGAGCGAS